MPLALACTLRATRTNHTGATAVFLAGFSRGGEEGVLSVLQLLQALQGFSASPDKAAQLDASLQ